MAAKSTKSATGTKRTQNTKKTKNTKKSTGAKSTKSTKSRKSSSSAAKKTTQAKAKTSASAKKNAKSSQAKGSSAKEEAYEEELQRQRKQSAEVWRDVLFFLGLAVCILLFLSCIGMGGKAGSAISFVLFGLFGLFAYALPFLLFLMVWILISNRGSRHALIKGFAVVLLLTILCAMSELGMNGFQKGLKILSYFFASVESKSGGGLFGGAVIWLLCPLIGKVCTWVVLVIFLIICVILIAERSLLAPIGRKSSKAYRDVRRRHQETAEIRRRQREEQEKQEKQETFSVHGVTFDTELRADPEDPESTVAGRRRRSPEVKELKPGQGKHAAQKKNAGSASSRPFMVNLQDGTDVSAEKTAKSGKSAAGKDKNGKKEAAEFEEPLPFSPDPVRNSAGAETVQNVQNASPEEISSETEGNFSADERPENIPERKSTSARRRKSSAASAAQESADSSADSAAKSSAAAKKTADSETEILPPVSAAASALVSEDNYSTPPLSLLKNGRKSGGDSPEHLRATAEKLEQVLKDFGVGVRVTNATCGPSVTRYELQPDQGVKVSRIVGLSDDIKLNLAAADIRIEAPIPGKAAVGIEVPNRENSPVMLRDLLESAEFQNSKSAVTFAVGKDIAGKTIVADIAKMPHLLIAGATGSGKSVCINTLIMSIIYKADPRDVKLILVDPKVVELNVYNHIPHLMIPVVTDPKKAAGALNWAVAEMEKRYKLFAEYNVRDLKSYNAKVEKLCEETQAATAVSSASAQAGEQAPGGGKEDVPSGADAAQGGASAGAGESAVKQSGAQAEKLPEKLPLIVIIIDELADLMMVAPKDVEGSICRLAQLARAAGLHLVVATQRPSVNVITGLIKANMPSRIAFAVSSGVDSRTIIDMNGAEKLLGKGDMLFYPSGYPKPVRVQGSFVSDEEIQQTVDYLLEHNRKAEYSGEVEEHIAHAQLEEKAVAVKDEPDDGHDEHFWNAGKLIVESEKTSSGMLQRVFKIGFNRAARILDDLTEMGVIGPAEGTKARKILMTKEEFDELHLQQTGKTWEQEKEEKERKEREKSGEFG